MREQENFLMPKLRISMAGRSSTIVMLSVAKHLGPSSQMLRFAQHDNRGGN